MASIGVRPKVSWMLSDSEVNRSAACHAIRRSTGRRPSRKWQVTPGHRRAAPSRIACSMASLANQPACTRCSRPPPRAASCRAARSSPRYIGSGCALPWKDSRPTNRTTTSSGPMPSARRPAERSCASGAKAAQSTPSGITGSCGRTKAAAAPKRPARYSCCCASTRSTVERTACDVHTSASQACTGASSRPAIRSIAPADAVVCVTPQSE